MAGYIKLQRSFFTHWMWDEKHSFSKAEAFLDLLQLAAFVPTKRMISVVLFDLQQGELVASVRYLSARWTWGKEKVCGFLKLLELDGMLIRQTRQGISVISLCNYAEYNPTQYTDPDSNRDSHKTPAGQVRDKVEEDKEEEERERTPTKSKIQRPTLSQAKSAATNLGITPQKADEWWHAREASEWMKGMAGGGISPVGSNWQADLKTYANRGGMGNDRQINGQTNGKSKATSAALYGI